MLNAGSLAAGESKHTQRVDRDSDSDSDSASDSVVGFDVESGYNSAVGR